MPYKPEAEILTAITDALEARKDQEKELDSLRAAYQDLQAVFDFSYEPMYVVNGDGLVVRVNSACERFFGIKARDWLGQPVRALEESRGVFPCVAFQALQKRERVTLLEDTPTGRRVMAAANPVFDAEGRISRVVVNLRDISELIQLRLEMEKNREMKQRYDSELEELRKTQVNADGIIARSPGMIKTLELARRVAGVSSTVLILGESGVGKNVVARYIHRLSPRRGGPFVEINCGAIPETLLESELFGYQPGAFTGARKEGKIGLIEMADGGTLFLNEIGELPKSLQVKLLQVIQDRELIRVGGTKKIQVDVRLISATNRDLKEMVTSGTFREDLYYRLNVVPIIVSALRSRKEDIPILVHHFVQQNNAKHALSKQLTPEALELLESYPWPGNVRELENVVERLVVMTEENLILPAHLPEVIRRNAAGGLPDEKTRQIPAKQELENLEMRLILDAYQKCRSTRKAAALLGMSQSTLSRRLRARNKAESM